MPLDSTSEIDTSKLSSVLHPAQIHFFKKCLRKIWRWCRKKLQNIPGYINITCWWLKNINLLKLLKKKKKKKALPDRFQIGWLQCISTLTMKLKLFNLAGKDRNWWIEKVERQIQNRNRIKNLTVQVINSWKIPHGDW